VLEIDKANPVFGANAVCHFLASKQLNRPLLGGDDLLVNVRIEEWCEWEEESLTPQFAPYVAHSLLLVENLPEEMVAMSNATSVLNLNEIETFLQHGDSFIVGDALTLADIALFCALLPLACGGPGSLLENLKSNYGCIAAYIERHATNESFVRSMATLEWSMDQPIAPLVVLSSLSLPNGGAPKEEAYDLSPRPTKRVMISTPIYYVNGEPHIGHVYTSVIADALNRWFKVRNIDSFFMTGTDEHGQKVAQSAEKNGMEPKEFCDKVSLSFRNMFDAMECKYDRFIRTTDVDHEDAVRTIWRVLVENDWIYKGSHEGWYCTSDEAFYTELQVEKDAEGNTVSKESSHVCEWKTEENYLFRLSKFQDRLLEWIGNDPSSVIPDFRRVETLNFISSGLRDLSVSRARSTVRWGIEVPEDEDQLVYVWLDALTNYLTGSGYPAKQSTDADWMWPADYHIMGKDIMRFHAVYWPAFLMGANISVPKRIVTHGWWTKDGQKISKSLGNVFDPMEVTAQYGVDALRYFLLREASVKRDGNYCDDGMSSRVNSDLADDLGNLVSRCISKGINAAQVVPKHAEFNEDDEKIIAAVNRLGGVVDHYATQEIEFQSALCAVWDVIKMVNGYITEQQPWKVRKTDAERADTILYVMMECLRVVAMCVWPVMPEHADKIFTQMGVPEELRCGDENLTFGRLPDGIPVGEDKSILFAKSRQDDDQFPKKNPKKKAGSS
jgi:methionyl-tRNA synthetase